MAIRIKLFLFCSLFCFLTAASTEQPSADDRQIRGALEFLSSDAMQGRGSGTHDELLAANYLASQLRQIGIEPAGDNGG
ncbi:MAG TPA: peptidase M28, partial [Candidatus Angelobacter sp.]